ncbi:MAG: lamin tail domain-containing protein [Sphingobacteriales bacterium]|nr:lamin tail domain-containing protein [Sphingobacteriales bacterium]
MHLVFANNFPDAANCLLTINNVKDLAGNSIRNATANFSYHAPHNIQQYDIIIDEIMIDPTPPVGLPNNEWIELKNASSFPIDLQGFTISNMAEKSSAMPTFILQPDSFVIICTASAVTAMSTFGKTISVTNFPSLNNTEDFISLNTADGKTIHAIQYSAGWYQNKLKENGGWSLEMINPKNPCAGLANWKASTDLKGGTPGKTNSVNSNTADHDSPKLLRAFANDSLHIILSFDEPLDSLKAISINNYSVNKNINIENVACIPPLFSQVKLKLANPLLQHNIYTITAGNITDCSGNVVDYHNTAKTGLHTVADSLDIVINEILFNPKDNGVDYVELYNRSNKIINLKQTYIANQNSNGDIDNIVPLSNYDHLLFPQDFVVATSSPAIVKAQYITFNPDAFVTVNNMPSFNDDKGAVIILNAEGNTIDELIYNASWHFKLINNPQGVALERINYNAPTPSSNNWHSAATSTGRGTPTYKNSQYNTDQQLTGEISVIPAIISPDNNGTDDFATIDYQFPEAGNIASITIFDGSGKPIRNLQQNALCGTSGNYHWDGLGENNQQLPAGIYIIYTTIFNLNGKTQYFKNTIVLARN